MVKDQGELAILMFENSGMKMHTRENKKYKNAAIIPVWGRLQEIVDVPKFFNRRISENSGSVSNKKRIF